MMKKRTNLLRFSNRFKMMLPFAFIAICSALIARTFAHTDVRTINDKSFLNSDTLLIEPAADRLKLMKDSANQIKENLIKEVFDYIKKAAPKSRMSAQNIVNQCIDKEYDITLLLAQGHQETHFATCGSNNCFGVVGKRYSHPDESVSGYINLMQRRYIGNKTTEQVLASNIQYIGSKNTHYSTSSNYGSIISAIRNKILVDTNIHKLFTDVVEINRRIDMLDVVLD